MEKASKTWEDEKMKGLMALGNASNYESQRLKNKVKKIENLPGFQRNK